MTSNHIEALPDHCMQAMKSLKGKHFIYSGTDAHGNDRIPFSHVCLLDDPAYKAPYDRTYTGRTNMHFGQRKLLMSEIQLLTEYYASDNSKADPVVVYVGAAPGSHLITLSRLFPRVRFILYDAARFDQRLLENTEVFKIRKEFFTEDSCQDILAEVSRDRLLFVSDIRKSAVANGLPGHKGDLSSAFEQGVMEDMITQQNWVLNMKPRFSLLKFRMPYNLQCEDKISFLDGRLLYGVWAKPTSGETRLLVDAERDQFRIRECTFKAYEETLAFHNKYVRTFGFTSAIRRYHKHIVDTNRYCPCYDCYAELSILEAYSSIAHVCRDNGHCDQHNKASLLEEAIDCVCSMDIRRAFWKVST